MSGFMLEDISRDLCQIVTSLDHRFCDDTKDNTVLAHHYHMLDDPEFDIDQYVLERFSDDASLSCIPESIQALELEEQQVNAAIVKILHEQTETRQKAKHLIGTIKMSMQSLDDSVQKVTEQTVRHDQQAMLIADDVKRLYTAKNHVSEVLQAIQKVEVLLSANSQLLTAVDQRDFEAAASLLCALKDLKQSKSLALLPNIEEILSQSDFAENELRILALEEFDTLFDPDCSSAGSILSACKVIDIFGSDLTMKIITTFVKTILASYEDLFKPGGEYGSVGFIKRRTAWLKKALMELDTQYIGIHFPATWCVKYHLCKLWCTMTAEHLTEILSASAFELSPEIFSSLIKHMTDNEKHIVLLFNSTEAEAVPKIPLGSSLEAFDGILTDPFDAHMGPWMLYEETLLKKSLESFEKNSKIYRNLAACYSSSSNQIGVDSENKRLDDARVHQRSYGEAAVMLELASDVLATLHQTMDHFGRVSDRSAFVKALTMVKSVLLHHLGRVEKSLTSTDSKHTNVEDNDDDLICNRLESLSVLLGTMDFYDHTMNEWESTLQELVNHKFVQSVTLDEVVHEIWKIRSGALTAILAIVERPFAKKMTTLGNTLKRTQGDSRDAKERDVLKSLYQAENCFQETICTLVRSCNEPVMIFIYGKIVEHGAQLALEAIKGFIAEYGMTPSDRPLMKTIMDRVFEVLSNLGVETIRLPQAHVQSVISNKQSATHEAL